ncbi:MAG: ABC transporter ATP-binding protein, partial [Planctomycetota bacterium]
YWGVFIYFEVLAAAAIIWLGSEALVRDEMSLGTLSAFLLYISVVFWPILMMGEQLSQVQRALAAADRVFDHLDIHPEVADRPGARDRVRLERKIRFEDVSFTYTGEKMVLEDVSFSIEKGEKVALVGPSGGGKTTLVSLLLRFVDPSRGRITVDGTDIRGFTLRSWRSRIGLVLQEIYLFPGTVLDNLRVLDESIPEASVMRAARTVKADGFISELPGGYGADLAERGANLSLGERQLLSFARALAFDPDILILDEATSSVDTETEARIQESLSLLLEGRTAVIVAHRLSTVRAVDRILVVKDGRIVEEGDHETLYRQDGLYRELYDLQMEGNRNDGGGK